MQAQTIPQARELELEAQVLGGLEGFGDLEAQAAESHVDEAHCLLVGCAEWRDPKRRFRREASKGAKVIDARLGHPRFRW
jgi:hypothetical protein